MVGLLSATKHRHRAAMVLSAALVLGLASCGGSSSSSSGRDAISGIIAAKKKSLASSKAASAAGDCNGAAPADYGRAPLCADSGFRRPDILPFANWAGRKYADDLLTTENLTALFGKSVCASVEGDTCTLTNGAVDFLKQIEKAYLNGRCEGMVVMASLLASQAVKLANVDPAAKSPSSLDPDTEALQKGIGYWWTTQYSTNVDDATQRIRKKGLKEILRQLEVQLSNGTFATMGLYYKGLGHALLPVGLMRGPDGIFHVVVYDSNLPDSFATVDIDLVADTWTYRFGASSGDSAAQVWAGPSGEIDLTPMSSRAAQAKCVYCKDKSPSDVTVSLNGLTVEGRDSIESIYR